MALDNKYRVHEVAKDFGVSTREITEILTKYRTEPKNHMQVLENHELDVIFEYMTQHNQAASLEDIFKVPEKPAATAKKEAVPEKTAAAPEKKPAQQSTAPAQPQQKSFDDMLKQFMTESSSKMSSIKQYSEHKTKTRRR